MPSIYEFDASSMLSRESREMFITLVDKQGNKYRVQSDVSGGFRITKDGANLVDAITVHPCCANEIRIN